jgi:GT2 family glycosyltransferase
MPKATVSAVSAAPGTANERHDGKLSLAIVILAYGSGEQVDGLLDWLRPDSLESDFELIVVHNPSDAHSALALSRSSSADVVNLEVNRGYAGGMNAGIRRALGCDPEFVLVLTHDVRITAADIEALLAVMKEHTDLGVSGPILCEPDGKTYSTGFIKENRIRTLHRLPAESMPRPVWHCAAVDGSAMMWRAAALRQIHGFDDRFFMYFEDVDICARAAREGWQIAIASDVRVNSSPGKGGRRSAHAYLRARNGLAYARTFGAVGLLLGLKECVVGLWRATPKPGGERFTDPAARRLARVYWRGTLLGALDYFRGRWGPPPKSMLRDSDIGATVG